MGNNMDGMIQRACRETENFRRIGILTQPALLNYGGIMQAYALKTVLLREGWSPVIVNRAKFIRKVSGMKRARRYVKRFFRILSGNRKLPLFYRYPCTELFIARQKNLRRFLDRNMPELSPLIFSRKEMLDYMREKDLKVFAVGSDQVWRPRDSADLGAYFLDFMEEGNCGFSYAASFGTEDLEYTREHIDMYAPLLARFIGISVREDSAAGLLRRHFGAEAEHVLDPTMLLDASDYRRILEDADYRGGTSVRKPHLMKYVLDAGEEKESVVRWAASSLGLEVYDSLPYLGADDDRIPPEDTAVPSMESWIAGFADAGFTVTDSFHGCVFSIIFNVPFIAIGNSSRGMARFTSLLRMFGLEDRLAAPGERPDTALLGQPDWNRVNSLLAGYRKSSMDYLRRCLALAEDMLKER